MACQCGRWIRLAESTSEQLVRRELEIHTGTENVFIGVIAIKCSNSQLLARCVRACVSKHVLKCFDDC
jgi:hypothetical protein